MNCNERLKFYDKQLIVEIKNNAKRCVFEDYENMIFHILSVSNASLEPQCL